MTSKQLRDLVFCLRSGFMTETDRFGWANDLEAMAKDMELQILDAKEERLREGSA